MDPVKEEKLQAMNKYNKSQFFNNLMLYSLTALICTLFFSYPYWFPSLCSSMNHFLFISLPNVWSFFSNPKCLFIIGNAIVIFLIGESKLASSQSPAAAEIYDEYVERSRSLRGLSTLKEKKEEVNLIEKSLNKVEEDKEVKGKEEEEEEEKEEEEYYKEGDGEEEADDDGDHDKERDCEEETGLPVEELNKRVEEFIARVNKQRWLEAKSLVCCSA